MQNTARHALTTPHSKSAALAKPLQAIASLQCQGGLDVAAAIKGKQLSYYRREAGEMPLVMAVQAYMLDLASAYNISRNIDEKQAAQIARALLQEYWWLKLAEIAVFVQMAKQGAFGRCYERLDQPTVFEWLQQYCEQRDLVLEEQHRQRKHNQEMTHTGHLLLEGLRKRFPEHYQPPQEEKKTLRSRLQDPEFVRFRLRYEQERKAALQAQARELQQEQETAQRRANKQQQPAKAKKARAK